MATEIPIEIISIFCQVLYREGGEPKTRDFALLGDEAKELENMLNSGDVPPVDWAAEAATVHQELSRVLLTLRHYWGSATGAPLIDDMKAGLDKLRAIPGVGAELERRATGRQATAVPGSGRSQRNPPASRRK